jgi:hypothetical protein
MGWWIAALWVAFVGGAAFGAYFNGRALTEKHERELVRERAARDRECVRCRMVGIMGVTVGGRKA